MSGIISNIFEDLHELNKEELRLVETIIAGLVMAAPSTERRMQTVNALSELSLRQQREWGAAHSVDGFNPATYRSAADDMERGDYAHSTLKGAEKTAKGAAPLEVVFSQIDAYKDHGRTVEAFASAEDADKESKRLGNPDGDNYFPGRYTLSTPEEAAEAFHAERVHPSELETALAARGWYKTVTQQVEAMHRAKKRQRFDFGG